MYTKVYMKPRCGTREQNIKSTWTCSRSEPNTRQIYVSIMKFSGNFFFFCLAFRTDHILCRDPIWDLFNLFEYAWKRRMTEQQQWYRYRWPESFALHASPQICWIQHHNVWFVENLSATWLIQEWKRWAQTLDIARWNRCVAQFAAKSWITMMRCWQLQFFHFFFSQFAIQATGNIEIRFQSKHPGMSMFWIKRLLFLLSVWHALRVLFFLFFFFDTTETITISITWTTWTQI